MAKRYNKEQFVERLKREIKQKHGTLSAFAESRGISRQSLNQELYNTERPHNLIKALGLTVKYVTYMEIDK